MSVGNEKVCIQHGDQRVEISLVGAEIRSWVRKGEELIWSGDPRWWTGTAPILFPVCGTPKDGKIRIDGIEREMTTHGFAAASTFAVSEKTDDSVVLQLVGNDEIHAVYPYAFRLEVKVSLDGNGLTQSVAVTNMGGRSMPYSVGIHPAFRFVGGQGDVLFDHGEASEIPLVRNRLVTRHTKPSGVVDRKVVIDTEESFKLGALCFFNSNSNGLVFRDSDGRGMRVRVGGFPHLVLWAAQGAEFLSAEAWTGHGDVEGFTGSFHERASTRFIDPGERHSYFGEFSPL